MSILRVNQIIPNTVDEIVVIGDLQVDGSINGIPQSTFTVLSAMTATTVITTPQVIKETITIADNTNALMVGPTIKVEGEADIIVGENSNLFVFDPASYVFTGNTSGNCISDIHVEYLYGCNYDLLNSPNLIVQTNTVFNGNVTADSFYGDGSNLTGIDFTGNTSGNSINNVWIHNINGFNPAASVLDAGSILHLRANQIDFYDAYNNFRAFFNDSAIPGYSNFGVLGGINLYGPVGLNSEGPIVAPTYYGDGSNLTGITGNTKIIKTPKYLTENINVESGINALVVGPTIQLAPGVQIHVDQNSTLFVFDPSSYVSTGNTSGGTGNSGTSGTSGSSGTSGTSGTSGSSGTSGTSAISYDFTGNTSGSCIQELWVEYLLGCNGTVNITGNISVLGSVSATTFYGDGSNLTGISGATGTSGTSGSSGTSGASGSSGTSGVGSSGTSGTSGTSADDPYYVYTALVSQNGTNDPTVTVLNNTIGALSIIRISSGVYHITRSLAFAQSSTWFNILPSNFDGSGLEDSRFSMSWVDIDTIAIYSFQSPAGGTVDSLLNRTPIEIRVYK